jgi:hypothetical protein
LVTRSGALANHHVMDRHSRIIREQVNSYDDEILRTEAVRPNDRDFVEVVTLSGVYRK